MTCKGTVRDARTARHLQERPYEKAGPSAESGREGLDRGRHAASSRAAL